MSRRGRETAQAGTAVSCQAAGISTRGRSFNATSPMSVGQAKSRGPDLTPAAAVGIGANDFLIRRRGYIWPQPAPRQPVREPPTAKSVTSPGDNSQGRSGNCLPLPGASSPFQARASDDVRNTTNQRDFQLSRVYAEDWNAARRFVCKAGDYPATIPAANPYDTEPERARWNEGFAKAQE
jgi:hypothetical protein